MLTSTTLCSILSDIRPDRRRIRCWLMFDDGRCLCSCAEGKRTMGYPIDYTNELSIYALPRLHNDNSANWKQRDHLLMIGWSCCYWCIKSWGDDRSGCMRVPVHSMIVDETLEVMWDHIMIFALDKCNDVVMGSWCIIGYVNVSIFVFERVWWDICEWFFWNCEYDLSETPS